MAVEVLNKCTRVPTVTSPESDSYWVEFDYEFVNELNHSDRGCSKGGLKKSKHPLSVMVRMYCTCKLLCFVPLLASFPGFTAQCL